MNTTKQLTDLTVLLHEQSKDLCQLTSEDLVLSWNGNSEFTPSSIRGVIPRMSNEMYRVYTSDREVVISNKQGFWLDGGEEIHPQELNPGKSKVYLKDGNSIKLTLIEGLEKVEGVFITYDVVGSEYRNYIVNDFILHNFDINDYVFSEFIGTRHAKADLKSDVWDDVYTTARAKRDEEIKAMNEVINATIDMAYINWNDTSSKNTILNDLNTDYVPAVNNLRENFLKFWNTVIPNGATSGTYYESAEWTFVQDGETPNLDIARLDNIAPSQIVVDLTSYQTFTPQIWNDYVDSIKAYKAATKRFFAKYVNVRIPEIGLPPYLGGFDKAKDITNNK